jgi:hypothetical protein
LHIKHSQNQIVYALFLIIREEYIDISSNNGSLSDEDTKEKKEAEWATMDSSDNKKRTKKRIILIRLIMIQLVREKLQEKQNSIKIAIKLSIRMIL